MKKLLQKHKKKLKILAIFIVLYIITIFLLGYKIPWFDKHPDWKEFPHITNKKIVIEEIKDFDSIYGNRYRIPTPIIVSDEYSFGKYNKTNLKNFKTIDFRVTDNKFYRDRIFKLSGMSGGNSTGSDYSPDFSIGFFNNGYAYLEIEVGHQKGYFKQYSYTKGEHLDNFYQYNYPKTDKDTLFFRNFKTDYKAYIK